MLGNDIVDLEASRQESNWQRKGWIQKLFTAEEQTIIHNADDKERMIWLFWSMKEAAYKIFNRVNKKMFYTPVAFQCSLHEMQDNIIFGHVNYKEYHYDTKSYLTTNYFHTIATTENSKTPVHISIINHNSTSLLLPEKYRLCKNEYGIPYLQQNGTHQTYDASLSHHGSFTALVFPEIS